MLGRVRWRFRRAAISMLFVGSSPPLVLTRYRGASRLSALFSRLSDESERLLRVDGSYFAFRGTDAYWNRLRFRGLVYEPEIRRVLLSISDIPYTFVDGGANNGLWSVLASSDLYGAKRTIAVEASGETLRWLRRNCLLSGHRFEIVCRALYSSSGALVSFGGALHEARGVGQIGEQVETVSLDDLLREYSVEGPIVVKLDVEGAEVEVLAPAKCLDACDLLLIYEDHGHDQSDSVTRHLLNRGYCIEFLGNASTTPIHRIGDLRALKTSGGVGYNLVCYARGGYWDGRISKFR